MSASTSIDVSFDLRVAPILFGATTAPEVEPSLMVVSGQPGSGKSAAIAAMTRSVEHPPAVVSADSLAAFHPDFLESRRWHPVEAQGALAPLVADWLSEALDYARQHRRSLIIEGPFRNSGPVFGTADSFAEHGFLTEVVVVAARRHESLLAAASRYLDLRRRGRPALFTDRGTHDRGWIGTQALVRDAEATAPIDRLTIVDHGGATRFEGTRAGGFTGATTALASVESAPVSTLRAAEWFSELRRITEYARSARELEPAVADVLVELHELALTDVLPAMNVRPGSSFFIEQQRRLEGELESLRQDATPDPSPTIEPPVPIVAPPTASPGLSL
ncbi:MAG: hypothetical protein CMF56_12885 [Leifsonia sp.]|nr:hypothetical protein [Leifsonia sp.]HBR89479.1 hypothetical protein [Microbacterium sp.]